MYVKSAVKEHEGNGLGVGRNSVIKRVVLNPQEY